MSKHRAAARLTLTEDELRALDDALSFVEGGRHEEENDAAFRAVVLKVRSAAERDAFADWLDGVQS